MSAGLDIDSKLEKQLLQIKHEFIDPADSRSASMSVLTRCSECGAALYFIYTRVNGIEFLKCNGKKNCFSFKSPKEQRCWGPSTYALAENVISFPKVWEEVKIKIKRTIRPTKNYPVPTQPQIHRIKTLI